MRDVDAILREEGAPWNAVVSIATETGADLIVVGTHGRRGVTHLLLGSVAERVVHLSPARVDCALCVGSDGAGQAIGGPWAGIERVEAWEDRALVRSPGGFR